MGVATPQNTEKSDKSGHITFVDLKYLSILKYFSVARKNLRRYDDKQIIYKLNTYMQSRLRIIN